MTIPPPASPDVPAPVAGPRHGDAAGGASVGMTELAWLLVTGAGVAALGDVALPFAARVLVQRYTFLNPHSAWLTPVPWLVVVLPVVALVALAGRWFPRHRDQALVTTVAASNGWQSSSNVCVILLWWLP